MYDKVSEVSQVCIMHKLFLFVLIIFNNGRKFLSISILVAWLNLFCYFMYLKRWTITFSSGGIGI